MGGRTRQRVLPTIRKPLFGAVLRSPYTGDPPPNSWIANSRAQGLGKVKLFMVQRAGGGCGNFEMRARAGQNRDCFAYARNDDGGIGARNDGLEGLGGQVLDLPLRYDTTVR